MKLVKTVLIVLFCAISLFGNAQEERRIAVSSYVADNSGVPPSSKNVLSGKLNNIITQSGFGSEMNQRFILTSRVNILTEEITPSTPTMYVYTLSIDLYLGDGVSGTLYSSTQVETKGVGVSKDKAYQQALKAIDPRSGEMKEFIETGKQKIVEYYNLNGESIIKSAETLYKNQQFEDAMWELSCIPEACTRYFNRAQDLMVTIYSQMIAQEGASILAEARSVWNAGQDRDAADRAGAILARINPQSPAFKEAQSLQKEIAARVKAIDNREWNFKLQQQKDNTSIRRAEINAARDIAVAVAKSRPKTIYKIYWW